MRTKEQDLKAVRNIAKALKAMSNEMDKILDELSVFCDGEQKVFDDYGADFDETVHGDYGDRVC